MAENSEIVERLQKHLEKYQKESGFNRYEEDTVIKDLVYFVGRSVDPERYEFAGGFSKFLKRLSEFPETRVLTHP